MSQAATPYTADNQNSWNSKMPEKKRHSKKSIILYINKQTSSDTQWTGRQASKTLLALPAKAYITLPVASADIKCSVSKHTAFHDGLCYIVLPVRTGT